MQIKLKTVPLAYFSFMLALNAFADTASSKAAADKAYNDFYRAVSAFKNPTAEQINQANWNILAPAVKAYDLEKHREHLKLHPTNSGKASGKRKKVEKASRLLDEKQETKLSAPGARRINTYTSPASTREDVVVDGKDFPKEIEFTGKKIIKPMPK